MYSRSSSHRKGGALLPHYTCLTCETQQRVSTTQADQVGELCPQCGSLLQPVTDVAELAGFRVITRAGHAAGVPRSRSHQTVADQLDGRIARRRRRRGMVTVRGAT